MSGPVVLGWAILEGPFSDVGSVHKTEEEAKQLNAYICTHRHTEIVPLVAASHVVDLVAACAEVRSAFVRTASMNMSYEALEVFREIDKMLVARIAAAKGRGAP